MQQKIEKYVYREVRTNVRHKFIIPCFVPLGPGIICKNGHASIYAISQEAARKIQASGTIKAWKPLHYSTVCWIDVDDYDAGDAVEKRCKDLDLFYARYFSGNKGWHFAIKRHAEPCSELYGQDRKFIREYFKDLTAYSYFDLGIYHPLHLLRGVGCIHEKTRKRKVLVSGRRGKFIPDVSQYEIDYLHKTEARYYSQTFQDDTWDNLKFIINYHTGPDNRGRYQAMWRLAKDLFRAGFKQSIIEGLIEVYNESFENPHSPSERTRAIEDAAKAVRVEVRTNPSGS